MLIKSRCVGNLPKTSKSEFSLAEELEDFGEDVTGTDPEDPEDVPAEVDGPGPAAAEDDEDLEDIEDDEHVDVIDDVELRVTDFSAPS